TKGVIVPTFDAVERAATRAELETEWDNMLGHQLPALPPFDQFWGELPGLFAWLAGEAVLEEAQPIGGVSDEDLNWQPPATAWVWGRGSALETIRFAAVNRLCVDLGYRGTHRIIEPYSLRRSLAGALLLHALHAGTREHRSYRADLIQSARVTTRPFRPVYAVEFGAAGPIPAPATARLGTGLRRSRRSARGSGPIYMIECPSCERRFRRTTRSTALRPHKDSYGDRCYGRRGYLVDTL
ncbi:MAG: WYL domain-containing protein, partial [Candidatus Limnocylindria bacterium]